MRWKHSCSCPYHHFFQSQASTPWEHKPCMTFPVLPITSSFTLLGWCSTWTSLPLYLRLGWYPIWQDVGYDFLSATKGLVEEKLRSSGSFLPRRWILTIEKWEMGGTCLFWPLWTVIRCSSSLHTCLETFMPSEHAVWAACNVFMLSEVVSTS